MDCFGLQRRQAHAIERLREQVVHQQTLHGRDHDMDVARDAFATMITVVQRGETPGCCIERERFRIPVSFS